MSERLHSHPKTVFAQVSPHARLHVLLGHYDLRVDFASGGYANIGRGSSGVLRHLQTFEATLGADLNLLEVGRFSEFAPCTILIGGEHDNSAVFNLTLNSFPIVRKLLPEKAIARPLPPKQVSIGPAVVVSTGAIILSGISVGAGAVIGAGAVVTRDVPPFSIVGGNPARIIRYRFSERVMETVLDSRWWDVEPGLILRNLSRLSGPDALDFLAEMQSQPVSPRSRAVWCRRKRAERPEALPTISIQGAEIEGRLVPLEEMPEDYQAYFDQIFAAADAEIALTFDIFRVCGI